MLWIVLVVAIGLLILGCYMRDVIEAYGAAAHLLFVFMLIPVSLSWLQGTEVVKQIDEKPGETIKLMDPSKIEGGGHFSGGSGNFVIATNEVYLYYYKTAEGGYKQGKVNAETTTIYEEKDCKQPRLLSYDSIIHVTRKYSGAEKIGRMILLFFSSKEKTSTDTAKNTRYEIYVPEGTVVQNFTLDAQ